MKVWLVTIGEPVPLEPGSRDRLHRTGYFAHFLAEQGHEVVWWTSAFDHFSKKPIVDNDTALDLGEGLRLRILKGCGYQKHVSLSRLLDHRQIAKKFAAAAEGEPRPDVIVAALPTLELCKVSVEFGERNDIPVVLDMRDMWPDIFVNAVPRPAQPIAQALLYPMFSKARQACRNATAIIGITDAFVDWGVARGGRTRSSMDRAFPLGYSARPPEHERIEEADRFWDKQGVAAGTDEFVICYFGGLGRALDLSHAIEAARLLEQRQVKARFVLCGSGERLEMYRQKAQGLSSVMLPGWMDRAHIYSLMRRASAGLDPMPDRYDFLATINNKAIEYLSAGLPVISSPKTGVLFDLLRKENCGASVETGDAAGLADLMAALASDGQRLRQMGQNASAVFERQFVAEHVYEKMTNYLLSVANLRTIKGLSRGNAVEYNARA